MKIYRANSNAKQHVCFNQGSVCELDAKFDNEQTFSEDARNTVPSAIERFLVAKLMTM